jgi:hypothetical protein
MFGVFLSIGPLTTLSTGLVVFHYLAGKGSPGVELEADAWADV